MSEPLGTRPIVLSRFRHRIVEGSSNFSIVEYEMRVPRPSDRNLRSRLIHLVALETPYLDRAVSTRALGRADSTHGETTFPSFP